MLQKDLKIQLVVSAIYSASFQQNYGRGKGVGTETMRDETQDIIKICYLPETEVLFFLLERKL